MLIICMYSKSTFFYLTSQMVVIFFLLVVHRTHSLESGEFQLMIKYKIQT